MLTLKFLSFVLINIGPTLVFTQKTPLYVGALLELTDHWWSSYTNLFPQLIEHAFEVIGNRSDILPEYELKLMMKDTKGVPGLAAKRLMEFGTEDPPKVAILGPGLSDELTVAGQVVPFYNMIQISYTATMSTTVSEDAFSTLYRVNQIDEDINPFRIQMMKIYNWERVGTLYYQDEIFTSQMDNFHNLLKDNNFTLQTSAVIVDKSKVAEPIRILKRYDVRIIMGAFRTSSLCAELFCEVYKQGLYGKRYAWILQGSSLYANWIKNLDDDKTPCPKWQIYEAAKGHFTIDASRLRIDNVTTISGMTAEEYSTFAAQEASQSPFKLSRSYSNLNDAVWSLAIGLNNSLSYLNGSGLRDYSANKTYLEAIMRGMDEVKFEGTTGPVAFTPKRRRKGLSFLSHNIGDTRTTIGTYNAITEEVTWMTSQDQIWPGGSPPKDRLTYLDTRVPYNLTAVVFIVIVNSAGVFTAIGFLAFNIIFRKNRNIKMSSPNINNVIIGGCMLMYISVYVHVVDYTDVNYQVLKNSICMVRVWILALGFTATFGALFSKTWRVHQIFQNNKLKRKVIKDRQLIGIVGLFGLIDLCLIGPWTLWYGLVEVEIRHRSEEIVDDNIVMTYINTHCYHDREVYWYAVVYIYKGLLLAFGTFLAWETRMIKVAALNDSKLIGFCVYNVVIVCAFGVPVAHILPVEQTTLGFVLISAFIIFCTTLVLCILFVPKIKLRNEVTDSTFVATFKSNTVQMSTSGNTQDAIRGVSNGDRLSTDNLERDDLEEEFVKIKEENFQLRQERAAETIAIAKLQKNILNLTGNLHFHKIGSTYVVFRTDNLNDHMQMCPQDSVVSLGRRSPDGKTVLLD